MAGRGHAESADAAPAHGGQPVLPVRGVGLPEDGVPATVADAVLAPRATARARHAARRRAARGRARPLRAVAGAGGARGHRRPGRGRAGGVLTVHPTAVGFRHELARRAVEGTLPTLTRMALNEEVLAALLAREAPDLDRMSTTRCRRAPTRPSSSTRRRRRAGPARRAPKTRARTCTAWRSTTAAAPGRTSAALGQAHAWALFHADRRHDAVGPPSARSGSARSSAGRGRWGGRWRSWPCSTRPTTGWARPRQVGASGRCRCSTRSATPSSTPRRWCSSPSCSPCRPRTRGPRPRRHRARDGRTRRRRTPAPHGPAVPRPGAMELGDPGGLDEVLREHGARPLGGHHRRRDDGLPEPGPPAVAGRPVRRGPPTRASPSHQTPDCAASARRRLP